MPAVVKERKVGPVTLLELGERLTADEVDGLSEKLQSLVAAGHLSVLLDCSKVTSIDSRGVGALVWGWTSVKKRGGKLKLLSLPPRMQAVLQVTGLLDVFEYFDDVTLALRSF